MVKQYSKSTVSREERVTTMENDLPIESIAGFVTCFDDRIWWLGCVLDVSQETNSVRLTLLEPHGPATSFKYPRKEDIRTLPIDNILTVVDPRTRTGRTYTLSKKEIKTATGMCNKLKF